MKYFAVGIFLATGVAYAQTNPLIPSGISSGCATFMASLDSDPQILSCTKAFTNVVNNFGVGSSSSDFSVSTVTSTLDAFSSALSTCSDSVIRSKLTDFYSACPNELTSSPNSDVVRAYDVLYTLYPFSKAIVSKDDTGKYCVFQIESSSNSTKTLLASSGTGNSPADGLWDPAVAGNARRGEEQVIIPNVQQFKNLNLVFLGLSSSLTSDQLCKTCTRNVLNQYIQFMSAIPYAAGITNSPLMSGEPDLYSAVQQKCGAPFLSGSVQAAGGISNGIINGAADLSVNTRTIAGALLAIAAGFFITL